MNESVLNFSKFVQIVKSRYLLIIFVLLLTVLIANLFGRIQPSTYEATATLIIDFNDPVATKSPLHPMLQSDYIDTQLGIIKSNYLAEKVIDQLTLEQNESLQDKNNNKDQEDILFPPLSSSLLLKNLNVYVHNKHTRLIKIAYTSESEQQSVKIANAFADMFIKTTLELRLMPLRQTTEWFEEQLKPLQRELEEAETKLTRYQQEKDIVVLGDDRSDLDMEGLTLLSKQLIETQIEWKNLESQINQIDQMADIVDLEKLPVVINNKNIQELKSELGFKENGLIEISNLYGKNHPTYINYMAELLRLRAKYSKELENIRPAQELMLEALKNKEQELQKSLDNQRKKIIDQREEGGDSSVLEREVEISRLNYKQAYEQYKQIALKSTTSQTNVTLLNSASMEIASTKIGITKLTALGAALGLCLGLFLALIAELLNRRILDASDLQSIIDAPLISEIGVK